MFTISKQFIFAASHVLHGLPPDHPCGRLHGHNYSVEVQLRSQELDERGFVRDYNELAAFQAMLNAEFDHRHLNEVLGLAWQPSAENLAQYFYGWCKQRWPETVAVRVSETPKTWAEYR